MPSLTLLQAVNDALKTEMRKDPSVVVLGEDVGKNGGVFRATDGLQAEFGEDRVMDTPLAESGIIGTAIGMALYGLKPVPEIQFQDFIYPAFDQIVSELAKMRYRSGGQYTCPVVVRAPYGGGIKGGHYHSQSAEAYFTHTPGLKVVIPSDPYDTKGLLISAIRDPDPVMFFEPKRIYRSVKGEVPEGEYTVPLGKAKIARPGKDMTIVAWGAQLHVVLEAAKRAQDDEIDCEVVDLRTLAPLDEETVLESVKKTGRMIIVHEAPRTSGFGGELAAIVAEKALEYLEAPIARVTGFDTPFPYTLEDVYMPDADRVLRAILATHRYVS
ncbi:MAG TPA: alpha-ketoacid dehydrogenase subunit beta [Planctomycetota bacterium]|nr:alpha-ketoacid dehydrogenase subunit beta [Planctomycetota bacterium]